MSNENTSSVQSTLVLLGVIAVVSATSTLASKLTAKGLQAVIDKRNEKKLAKSGSNNG